MKAQDENTLAPDGKRGGRKSSQREQHMQRAGQEKQRGIVIEEKVVPWGWSPGSIEEMSKLDKRKVSSTSALRTS